MRRRVTEMIGGAYLDKRGVERMSSRDPLCLLQVCSQPQLAILSILAPIVNWVPNWQSNPQIAI